MKTGSILLIDQANDHNQTDLTLYQCLLSQLMYLSCGTCPDITFVVGQLSCHNLDLQASHLRITKQVLC